MSLREATEDDRDLIRQWRNHPHVRRNSLTTHEIGEREHRRWWSEIRDDSCRLVLVYLHQGRPAGVVTFADIDTAAGCATWGFYLDVDGLRERGELLAAWLDLEREAIRFAFNDLGMRKIGGETLASNHQVLQLHRRFGFRVTDTYRREIDGVPREIVHTELRAPVRP